MQIKSLFLLAASAVMAMAGDVEQDITTTSTSTMTRTITITECNPTATDCPNYRPPKINSTVSAQPTWYHRNESSWAVPTHKPTVIETSVLTAPAAPAPTKAKPTTVTTSGADVLILRSGLMLSLLGAGVALLA